MIKEYLNKKSFVEALIIIMIFVLSIGSIFAIDGVWHNPYGIDCLYTIEETERYPRDPVDGENVYIKITTWPQEMGQSTWITWNKNGTTQSAIGGSWKYNSGNNSYWEVDMGSLSKGDDVQYWVHGNKDGANQKTVGPFSFTVTGWESVNEVTSHTDYSNRIEFNAMASTGSSFSPKINICFEDVDNFRVQMSPTGSGMTATGQSIYTVTSNASYVLVTTTALQIKIERNPYRMLVYESDGSTLIGREYASGSHRNMSWLTDGTSIIDKVEDNFYSPVTEEFFGFGEHYNNFEKRGQNVDTYVYNQYKNQNEKTYMAIPFFLNSNGYGFYGNSLYYSRFELGTRGGYSDMYSYTVNTGGGSDSMLDYYFIWGNDLTDVVANYSDVTEKPALPPKWAFGLWMSANEWDRQTEVLSALDNLDTYDIPATVLVLEQWSDESTFYIFNDATYTATSGANALDADNFTFTGKWPTPASMVSECHDDGIKVLLWQVPILKYTGTPHTQNDNDRTYMESQNYTVGDGSGGHYKLPTGKWFAESYLCDFTSEAATTWWMSKREYLFDDIGIDGFKTDGGEMLWGRWNTLWDGSYGDEMRNQYPNEYTRAYNEFTQSETTNDGIIFSRSGTQGVQSNSTFWSGDQESNFTAFQQAMIAGLTANMSGVPFIGWDLAGFTGTFPSAELYKRSAEMSALWPIMQIHSENSNPSPSEERTPWNVASRNSDSSVISTFTTYANIRMNLLPYIYSEAKKTSDTGVPFIRAMVLEAPDDTNTYDLVYQYMFGQNILVAPIVDASSTSKTVYLTEGEWIDIEWGAQSPGARNITYGADVNDIPFFAKRGAIIPMNLNADYEMGETIGNSMTSFTSLTFRVYPYGDSSYDWYDDVNSTVRSIQVSEEFDSDTLTVTLPAITTTSTLQIFSSEPTSVTAGGVGLTEYASVALLKAQSSGWCYDDESLLTYVKLGSSASARNILIGGIEKAPYEAEFATLNNTATDTDHTGYLGIGFVDQFETSGDYVEFYVNVPNQGSYTVDFRYSSGASNSTRSIYVNDSDTTDISMPQTADWDTWATTSCSLTLNAGNNRIKISYDAGNTGAINLDGIVVNN